MIACVRRGCVGVGRPRPPRGAGEGKEKVEI